MHYHSIPAISADNFASLLQPSPIVNTHNNASASPFQMVCFSCYVPQIIHNNTTAGT